MNYKVAVGVGHYPGEEGKEEEYNANVKCANLLHNQLVLNGYRAELIEGHLTEKIKIINTFNPHIAIDCHFNALDGEQYGSGFEVCTWKGSTWGKMLGAKLVESFQEYLPFDRRGKYGIWERNDLYFLKHTKCPAVISEPLFLDNPIDNKFVEMKRGFEIIATALYKGITQYFTERYSSPEIPSS